LPFDAVLTFVPLCPFLGPQVFFEALGHLALRLNARKKTQEAKREKGALDEIRKNAALPGTGVELERVRTRVYVLTIPCGGNRRGRFPS